MQYKYAHFINELTACPPPHYENREFTAYRFVFADINHTNNFLPVLAIKPSRAISTEFTQDDTKCLGYALSLFDTFENAGRRYRQISRYNRNFSKMVGTHIAKGEIATTDGLASSPDDTGHISLHEYQHTDLKMKFRIIGEA
jgi:hypothetical protein